MYGGRHRNADTAYDALGLRPVVTVVMDLRRILHSFEPEPGPGMRLAAEAVDAHACF